MSPSSDRADGHIKKEFQYARVYWSVLKFMQIWKKDTKFVQNTEIFACYTYASQVF